MKAGYHNVPNQCIRLFSELFHKNFHFQLFSMVPGVFILDFESNFSMSCNGIITNSELDEEDLKDSKHSIVVDSKKK